MRRDRSAVGLLRRKREVERRRRAVRLHREGDDGGGRSRRAGDVAIHFIRVKSSATSTTEVQ